MSWNASLKSYMCSCYDAWLSEPSVHEFTKGGKVKRAWEAVPVDTLKKSFLTCMITLPIDGSKDNQIHCFKSGQPCAVGLPLLQAEMAKLMSDSITDDTDPFASDSDAEETEKNEACIDSEDEHGDSGSSDTDS